MPSLKVVCDHNANFAPKTQPVVVVFGGTSGIGAGTLQAFAHHTKGNVHIVILGRAKASAEAIFAALPKHPEGLYEFVSVDALLMRNIVEVSNELKTNSKGLLRKPLTKINYLVLSQGALLLSGPDTDEGLPPFLALSAYGRLRAALELVPLIEEAARLGEGAQILSIGAAGHGGPVYLEDVALRRTSLYRMRGAMITYKDIMVLEFAARHPTVGFTHIHPGFVSTNFGSNLPWIFRILGQFFYLFAKSAKDCGEWMMYAITEPASGPGPHFKSPQAEDVGASRFADEVTRGVVWNHSLEASTPKAVTSGLHEH
ncbi:NAD(P)-binding protein [Auriculariales sp. MPI-PUGE-AT-0066]|nr:NAD(P)-binding protein [Auriculariales sp. MPI-PUGE-AT-0066]